MIHPYDLLKHFSYNEPRYGSQTELKETDIDIDSCQQRERERELLRLPTWIGPTTIKKIQQQKYSVLPRERRTDQSHHFIQSTQ